MDPVTESSEQKFWLPDVKISYWYVVGAQLNVFKVPEIVTILLFIEAPKPSLGNIVGWLT